MHIIAGNLRSRKFRVPNGLQVRPTTGRVREAVFNMIESRQPLSGASVLDLFAGTGSLGLEALSRGAATVTFVEKRSDVLRLTQQNARDLGVHALCQFRCMDVVSYLSCYQGPAFDVVFADPPYDLVALPCLADQVTPHLADEGMFVLEHDRRHSFDSHPLLAIHRLYGRTRISIFCTPGKSSFVI